MRGNQVGSNWAIKDLPQKRVVKDAPYKPYETDKSICLGQNALHGVDDYSRLAVLRYHHEQLGQSLSCLCSL